MHPTGQEPIKSVWWQEGFFRAAWTVASRPHTSCLFIYKGNWLGMEYTEILIPIKSTFYCCCAKLGHRRHFCQMQAKENCCVNGDVFNWSRSSSHTEKLTISSFPRLHIDRVDLPRVVLVTAS